MEYATARWRFRSVEAAEELGVARQALGPAIRMLVESGRLVRLGQRRYRAAE